MRRVLFLVALAGLAVGSGGAHDASPAPTYKPRHAVSGTIRIWGHHYMSTVTRYWAEGFRRYHPQAKFEIRLMGSATAMPGLYSGLADLAVLGRENNITDDNGFGRVRQYKPVRFELMTGSLDVPGKASALVVFVHKDNPLAKLTLAQLDAIFGCEPRRGREHIRRWGQLGLTGEWADKGLNLHSFDAETGTGLFFSRTVLGNSRKMNWESLQEYKDVKNPDGSVYRSGQQIVDALEGDRYGMAISSIGFANPGVKALALAAEEGGPYYPATKETLIARQYPLTRMTYAFADQPPGKPMDPKVTEFLRYVFSREGQDDVLRDGGYLPLDAATLAAHRRRLE